MSIIPLKVIDAAQVSQQATGIPASVTIAQWAVESGWGLRCTGTNNFFGVKAIHGQPSTMVPTHEVIDGHRVLVNAAFANYPTMADAFNAHAMLLTGPRYAAARACLPDVVGFVQKMAPTYATDPHYADLLIEIIKEHQLERYDRITA